MGFAQKVDKRAGLAVSEPEANRPDTQLFGAQPDEINGCIADNSQIEIFGRSLPLPILIR
jgi:hypothetical protein